MTAARQRADFLPETTRGVGAKTNVSTIKLVGEFGDGVNHHTVLRLINHPVTVGNTTGVSFGGSKIYDFPAGRIECAGAVEDVSFGLGSSGNVTPIDSANGGDFSVGSSAPSDGTLTGTDVDIVPSTSIDPISGGVANANASARGFFGSRAAAADAFFNILIDDADVGDGASDVILVNAVVHLDWKNHNLGSVY